MFGGMFVIVFQSAAKEAPSTLITFPPEMAIPAPAVYCVSASPSRSSAGTLFRLAHSPSKSSVASRSRSTGIFVRLFQSAATVVASTENSFAAERDSPVPAVY